VTGDGLVEVRSTVIFPPGLRKLTWNLKYGSFGITLAVGAWADTRVRIKMMGAIFLIWLILRPD
jgi:hypothetical protein